eukprot:3961428-Amphidinium_carterae.1
MSDFAQSGPKLCAQQLFAVTTLLTLATTLAATTISKFDKRWAMTCFHKRGGKDEFNTYRVSCWNRYYSFWSRHSLRI